MAMSTLENLKASVNSVDTKLQKGLFFSKYSIQFILILLQRVDNLDPCDDLTLASSWIQLIQVKIYFLHPFHF